MPLAPASFERDVTFGPTEALPMRHQTFYTFDVENAGAAIQDVSLQVRGFFVPGVPVSGTSTFKVGEVPVGAATFSFEASNIPFARACAQLVGSDANTALPISDEACSDLHSAQGWPSPERAGACPPATRPHPLPCPGSRGGACWTTRAASLHGSSSASWRRPSGR